MSVQPWQPLAHAACARCSEDLDAALCGERVPDEVPADAPVCVMCAALDGEPCRNCQPALSLLHQIMTESDAEIVARELHLLRLADNDNCRDC